MLPRTACRHFVFCLYPQHAAFGLVSALEVLRHANRQFDQPVYRWSFVTEDNRKVNDSNGLPLNPTVEYHQVSRPDRIFVVAGFNAGKIWSPGISNWLINQARRGVVIGGISNGGFVLARTGLLDNYMATVHWEDFSHFCELYPRVNARYQRFVIDRDRITCSGGASTLDLFLELVRQDHGTDVASFASRQMLLQDFSSDGDSDSYAFGEGKNYSAKVQRALSLLDAGIEDRMGVDQLARRIGLGRRELLRLFKRETGYSPIKILQDRRLQRARSLVLHSHLPLINVANAVGFSSQSHMTRSYRQRFGITPAKERAAFRTARTTSS